MMHFRNNSGFLLLEVMIALASIAMLLSPLFILQGRVFRNVSRSSLRMQRIFFAEQFLYEARREQKNDPQSFVFDSKKEYPVTSLTYELGPVPDGSALKSIPGLLLEWVRITSDTQQPAETMVTFLYRLKEEQAPE